MLLFVDLHKFPKVRGHKDRNGAEYNVQIEWETGEILYHPLDAKLAAECSSQHVRYVRGDRRVYVRQMGAPRRALCAYVAISTLPSQSQSQIPA